MADIYWIEQPQPGRVGIAPRPRGGDWLLDDLRRWRAAGADVVVSLLTPEEAKEFELTAEREACREAGLTFHSVPIPDRSVPASEAGVVELVEKLRAERERGKNLVLHCRQGIGRSSLVAAAILSKAENPPITEDQVWAAMEQTRGRPVPDTPEQRTWADERWGYWTRLENLLKPHGIATRQFLTGRVSETGSILPGDLLFIPHSGPHKDLQHVVEFKWGSLTTLPPEQLRVAVDALLHVRSVNGRSTRLALAASSAIQDEVAAYAKAHDVEVWPKTYRVEDVVERVLRWG